MSSTESGREILARIKPKLAEASTEICLRPDLLDAYHEAVEALARTEQEARKSDRRMATKVTAEVRAAAERVREVEAELEAASVTFHFRALPKDVMRALKDEHPPRKGNELDIWRGYNVDAVVEESVYPSLVSPVFDEDTWAELVETINDGEWEELRRVAGSVNGQAFRPPKSRAVSEILTRAERDSD